MCTAHYISNRCIIHPLIHTLTRTLQKKSFDFIETLRDQNYKSIPNMCFRAHTEYRTLGLQSTADQLSNGLWGTLDVLITLRKLHPSLTKQLLPRSTTTQDTQLWQLVHQLCKATLLLYSYRISFFNKTHSKLF